MEKMGATNFLNAFPINSKGFSQEQHELPPAPVKVFLESPPGEGGPGGPGDQGVQEDPGGWAGHPAGQAGQADCPANAVERADELTGGRAG